MVTMAASVTVVLLNSFGGWFIPKPRKKFESVRNITLRVPSMRCQVCLSTVTQSVSELEEVLLVEGILIKRRLLLGIVGKKMLKTK
jgi:hypothetical protein